MLQALHKWFAERPDLRMPPVLGVLRHIDLLSPAMEWQPPYDWQNGERPKERNIREAVAAAKEQLGELVEGVVPVCTSVGKVYGIEEGLLPALAARLDEARVVAVLRCLRNEADEGKARRVVRQMFEAGKGLLRAVLRH
jgi:predicted GTPase